jgi:hypothetical protein
MNIENFTSLCITEFPNIIQEIINMYISSKKTKYQEFKIIFNEFIQNPIHKNLITQTKNLSFLKRKKKLHF